MIQLLQLDAETLINPSYITQINIRNLNAVRQERGQSHQTPEQRARMDGLVWEVCVYLRSGSDGYNPQAYIQRFKSMQNAQSWINDKFGAVVITKL